MASPIVLPLPEDFRDACNRARADGKTVALVPTMGALHEGHLGLVRIATEAARKAGKPSFVVASIFVNPTQFGPNEDFARYPRDLEGDRQKLASAGADAVFTPDAASMYPPGEETRVRVGQVAEPLCGAFRPAHFEGVATVVSKLFALVGPAIGVFGKKDYQQLAVLRRMTIDLFFPMQLIGAPIVRERDGLAMSSRNAYLSPADREKALGLSRGLAEAWRAHASGERRAGALRAIVQKQVEAVSPRIDYVSVADPDTLRPLGEDATVGPRALIAIAAYLGATRLIDNVVLGEDPSPAP